MPAEIARPLPPSIDALPPSYLIKTPLNSPFSQEAKLETFPLMLGPYPNITGGFGRVITAAGFRGVHFQGDSESGTFNRNVTDNGGEISTWVDFDASRSDTVYGYSTTVQPSSFLLIPCIKI